MDNNRKGTVASVSGQMKFLRKIKGIAIFEKACNSAIREFPIIKSLLLHIKISA